VLRFGLWPCYCRIVGGLLKAKLEVNAVANMPSSYAQRVGSQLKEW